MKIASVNGRAAIVAEGHTYDIEHMSHGEFPASPAALFEVWQQFRDWASGVTLDGARRLEVATLGPPSPRPRQVFGIGLNYRAHALEAGMPVPDVPLVFTKFQSSITGPVGTIPLPTPQVDWEVELAVIIGRTAHRVVPARAWEHVAGVTAAQDISARDVQMRPVDTPQFSLGKSFPCFTPLGPFLVTPDELDDPDDVGVSCILNDELVQQSRTSDLIFSVPELIAYLSSVLPLLPGDVILTGTPSGVGMGRRPQRFLASGDTLTTVIDGVGQMRHECVTS